MAAVQLVTEGEAAQTDAVLTLVREHTFLSVSRYAALAGLPLMVAEDRLRTAELAGALCRDDSIHGLRFYPNQFLVTA